MHSISEAINAAIELHRRGELAEAEAIYRKVLFLQPEHPQAWHLLGLIQHQAGRNDEALAMIAKAISIDPSQAQFHNHHGTVLSAMGRREEAEASFRRAIELDPADGSSHFHMGALLQLRNCPSEAASHYRRAIASGVAVAECSFNLGQILRNEGQFEAAASCYRDALASRPDLLEASMSLATLLEQLGKDAEAEAHWREAIRHHPQNAEAHFRLGTLQHRLGKLDEASDSLKQALTLNPNYTQAHNNLGCVYRDVGQTIEAEQCFRRALALAPEEPALLVNLGSALHHRRMYVAAVDCYRRALDKNPNLAAAHAGLGSTLCRQKLYASAADHFSQALALEFNPYTLVSLGAAKLYAGDIEEATAHLKRAVELVPNDARAQSSLATALFYRQQLDESLAGFARAQALDPELAEAHYNRSFPLLCRGDFKEGWREYRWRSKTEGWQQRDFTQPEWDGSPLDGRTLLVHAEQGLGDTLQFIRFARVAENLGWSLWLEVPPALIPILRASGFRNLVAADTALPPFDVHLPMMSLAGVLGNSEEEIGACTKYLAADPTLASQWRETIRATPGWKVGICWQGNPEVVFDRLRSIPLREFAPLAAVKGVELISLQKQDGCEQLAAVNDRFTVRDLGSKLDNDRGAFMDTAAIISNLDLVVTSDTSVAHLAGGMGAPVWLALCAAPEFRWMRNRSDSPWYPTMRLFRQSKLNDWTSVFKEMADELSRHFASCPHPAER